MKKIYYVLFLLLGILMNGFAQNIYDYQLNQPYNFSNHLALINPTFFGTTSRIDINLGRQFHQSPAWQSIFTNYLSVGLTSQNRDQIYNRQRGQKNQYRNDNTTHVLGLNLIDDHLGDFITVQRGQLSYVAHNRLTGKIQHGRYSRGSKSKDDYWVGAFGLSAQGVMYTIDNSSGLVSTAPGSTVNLTGSVLLYRSKLIDYSPVMMFYLGATFDNLLPSQFNPIGSAQSINLPWMTTLNLGKTFASRTGKTYISWNALTTVNVSEPTPSIMSMSTDVRVSFGIGEENSWKFHVGGGTNFRRNNTDFTSPFVETAQKTIHGFAGFEKVIGPSSKGFYNSMQFQVLHNALSLNDNATSFGISTWEVSVRFSMKKHGPKVGKKAPKGGPKADDDDDEVKEDSNGSKRIVPTPDEDDDEG